jgi:hypothetical protein
MSWGPLTPSASITSGIASMTLAASARRPCASSINTKAVIV